MIKSKIVFALLVFLFLLFFGTNDVYGAQYSANVNTEIISLSHGNNMYGNYVYGNIVILEYMGNQATYLKQLPRLTLKSEDGAVSIGVFVQKVKDWEYYFDVFIDGLDQNKKYYIEVDSNNPNNISTR
jgi:hypothetical protein